MVINLSSCEGHDWAAGFPGNWWAYLTSLPPIKGSLCPPCPPVAKMAATPSLLHTVQVSLQDFLLRPGEIPCPTSHWFLCLCPGSVFGLRLGNHKPCRPVGCSPTWGNNAHEGIGKKKQGESSDCDVNLIEPLLAQGVGLSGTKIT